ncbi:hypothetical protein QR680_015083 [Steinernema hermaphroditum]|uniref:Uncharacterized protein n=1 Tax=Steinernema hermaphroditum TaxID=289476 RepID=A0AA39IB44_9BILA|nr:hypothetical protein QR680_015083 [Steinernema hermaphroditum]
MLYTTSTGRRLYFDEFDAGSKHKLAKFLIMFILVVDVLFYIPTLYYSGADVVLFGWFMLEVIPLLLALRAIYYVEPFFMWPSIIVVFFNMIGWISVIFAFVTLGSHPERLVEVITKVLNCVYEERQEIEFAKTVASVGTVVSVIIAAFYVFIFYMVVKTYVKLKKSVNLPH